ncbi:flagellar basal-body rod modification protein FlgD [Palleronia marisminoris]|uniref:Basal-body rod modification protein FlgD n=1 Tax=Palleronia marisminoris TaxID=315423 RepID=A0A1Y5SWN9_9RHOB|nr:flagellar hook capping FlgD N-terminal domain-containing protein [Palleronia marisminoris]SFG95043.1 flagellar basal-body rod modification protein FlgD [Palleronia marisminoris]SLN46743.1 flagellar basal body rod modification protein [Palleronia marisminoris]
MDISSTTNQALKPTNAIEPAAAKAINSDFETFLKLLTTQISNQDPMDPMKAEEFAVQLATFSSVEQQVKTNDLLTQMTSAGGDFAAYTSWIGREVKATAPLKFNGTTVQLAPEAATRGETHQLVVRAENGAEIDRFTVDGTGAPEEWTGLTAAGAAPFGYYTFEVESFSKGELVASQQVAGYAKVREVQRAPDGVTLVLEGGKKITASDVAAVRDPA